MVGRRVIEMLVERGAKRVVSLDIAEVAEGARHPSGKVSVRARESAYICLATPLAVIM